MPCRELRFCLWYFMWSTKIRKTVFVQKVAETKRKHPKSEDFRCFLELLTRFELVTSSLPTTVEPSSPCCIRLCGVFFVQKG